MKIKFPDGNIREYPNNTTGYEIAKSISDGLARNAIAISVDGTIYDIFHPISQDCDLRILTFDDEDGKKVYWHSSAHLMAEALQHLYPGIKFGIGPAIEMGFYYDVDLPEGTKLTAEELPIIEAKMMELAKTNANFVRENVEWNDAMKHWRDEIKDEYKAELLEGFQGQEISFYKHNTFTDLCRGPHLPNTGFIKSVKLLSIAGAYWRGDSNRKMMTRIYGITFPKKKLLDDYLTMREEAEKRDHRKLGKELDIYMITPNIGGGLPVWLPNGTRMRRIIEDFMRKEHIKRGYKEVVTPHLGNLNLYKTSGHYPYYSDSQFPPMIIDDEEYLLKPMNCPHHHQIYLNNPHSYKDLPLRLFELGTVYRYEQSGELSGLTRVRGFTQDDAHLYCTVEQLKDEVKDVVALIHYQFKVFGMADNIETRLSFRDNEKTKYGGEIELWDKAQREITEVAEELGLNYVIAEGEAAFYGPKIDFIIKDAIGRKWQLGTVQVDYVMPERFNLEYIGADNAPHRPVVIHRAPLGSMERFMAILIEHYAGNFPFWICPTQISILPIGTAQFEYAQKLDDKLTALGFRTKIDTRNEKINRKIAESEQQKIPFALIIGQKEMDANTISVRQHTKGDIGAKTQAEIIDIFSELIANKK
ncbi:MAG: threonine--tRNA ligase [Ignavibacteria bacterium]|jgi:threonyl-tRNA synthetase|nr:threonine--tRNA ligase [Ignavibacteria bacterium]